MKQVFSSIIAILVLAAIYSCVAKTSKLGKEGLMESRDLDAKEFLGNPDYQAISYGGYRQNTREVQPTVEDIKEDMRILSAMGIKVVRTYNVHFPQASNVLKAIAELKTADPKFEMYVMLGAWINCENAFTDSANHEGENEKENRIEIERAVALANQYSDIVKIFAVGNEAMVKWAADYYVQPGFILKWVSHLQKLKSEGKLPKSLWITCSDNFASWGGGGSEYHVDDLEQLMRTVDYISMHTYPMHDTHHNPAFWGSKEEDLNLSKEEAIYAVMEDARDYAISQYTSVRNYMEGLGIDKPIHIGETGWATFSNGFFGKDGSRACDEYKEALYYKMMREWSNHNRISCFYFAAFDENWKDSKNPGGSENHFGLFTIEGKAKYVLWDLVDKNVFNGLERQGNPIEKTFGGNMEALLEQVQIPEVNKSKVRK